MSEETHYLGVRLEQGEVQVACAEPEAIDYQWDEAAPIAILSTSPFRLFRDLRGMWSVYEIQFRRNKPIRLRLVIASERQEARSGSLSPKYIKPTPAILLAIADGLKYFGGAHQDGG